MKAPFGRALLAVSLLTLCDGAQCADTPPASPDAVKLHALFADEWQWTLKEYPEFATGVGDNRYNDKLTDLSAQAMDQRKAHERDMLRRLREIDRGRLTGQDIVSYDLALSGAVQDVAMQRFPAGKLQLGGEWLTYYEWMPVTQMSGVHIDVPALPRLAPLRNTKDYDDFLARLACVPRQIDQVVELMRRAMAAGWTPPAVPMRKVLPQIEQQCVGDVTLSPLYKPFEDFPAGIAPTDRSRLSAGARKANPGIGRPRTEKPAQIH